MVEAYYRLEDVENLQKLIQVMPENSPILDKIGEKFQSIGLCEQAVEAYVKYGDVKKAIDCCVLLN